MEREKSAGVLCHISSLPGNYGIGSLGEQAYRFADKLRRCGVKYWQILPLVQTGFGDSPYQSVSCTSGNPYFIDLDLLAKQKLLTKEELKAARHSGDVDYGALYTERYATLRKAFSRFFFDDPAFRAFVKEGNTEDYALFMTAKTVYGGGFVDWQEDLKYHRLEALEKLRTDHHEEYLFWQFLQYEFDLQWKALKKYCNQIGIKILGDIPLYCAYDSADVWAHPDLFKLDGELKPRKVAGVPPDYFSAKGQLWGNPVYDWEAQEKTGYAWWKGRLRAALRLYDAVRIDHFRGIDRYYEVDFGREDATVGEWKNGPGEKLFEGIEGEIIAEDLGTDDESLRGLLHRTGFPGMKVLLFAFDGNPENPFLPHNHTENSVCYTGTHDNDTVAGYVSTLSSENFILFRSRVAQELERLGILVPLGEDAKGICEAFLRMALFSRANLAVIPVQDVLGLKNDCRMNCPGTDGGNWKFRLPCIPKGKQVKKFKKLIELYGRN